MLPWRSCSLLFDAASDQRAVWNNGLTPLTSSSQLETSLGALGGAVHLNSASGLSSGAQRELKRVQLESDFADQLNCQCFECACQHECHQHQQQGQFCFTSHSPDCRRNVSDVPPTRPPPLRGGSPLGVGGRSEILSRQRLASKYQAPMSLCRGVETATQLCCELADAFELQPRNHQEGCLQNGSASLETRYAASAVPRSIAASSRQALHYNRLPAPNSIDPSHDQALCVGGFNQDGVLRSESLVCGQEWTEINDQEAFHHSDAFQWPPPQIIMTEPMQQQQQRLHRLWLQHQDVRNPLSAQLACNSEPLANHDGWADNGYGPPTTRSAPAKPDQSAQAFALSEPSSPAADHFHFRSARQLQQLSLENCPPNYEDGASGSWLNSRVNLTTPSDGRFVPRASELGAAAWQGLSQIPFKPSPIATAKVFELGLCQPFFRPQPSQSHHMPGFQGEDVRAANLNSNSASNSPSPSPVWASANRNHQTLQRAGNGTRQAGTGGNLVLLAPLNVTRRFAARRHAGLKNSCAGHNNDGEDKFLSRAYEQRNGEETGYDCNDSDDARDGLAEAVALVPSQARGRLPLAVAEQMSEQASKFVRHHASAAALSFASAANFDHFDGGSRTHHNLHTRRRSSGGTPLGLSEDHAAHRRHHQKLHSNHSAANASHTRQRHQGQPGSHSSSTSPRPASQALNAPTDTKTRPPNNIKRNRSSDNNLQVRRTLRVKVRKSKPILGIAIEGGFNVSGQLIPRIVCVHEEGAAYQCGKLRASDLILEVNGVSTVDMTHDEIAETIANAYYQDERPYIEFLIGESVHV